MTKIKSSILGLLFHAPKLYLGPGSLVRGAKHIKFGRGVYATSALWLEAVTRYRGQQFDPKIEIGDGVSFSHGVHITCIDRIVIKARVLMGSRIYISDHNHGSYIGTQPSQPDVPPAERLLGGGGPVFIGEKVWIGDNVVIVGPVTIGDGAVIGANSVVRKDVPPGTIVGGIPARLIKQFNPATQNWESS